MLINLRDKNGKLVIKDILDIDFNMCVAEEAGEYVVQINSTYNYADKYPSERAAENQMLRIAHARNAIEEELRNY